MRKRWSVLIVGQSGLAASHRAEVGRHRSEAAARRAAEVEWQRLVATRGGSSHGYRVVLEHDGEEVEMERVVPRPEPPIAPEPPVVASPLDGGGGHAPTPLVAVQPAPARAPGRERPPRPEIPEPPAGPVPEDILARWAREEPARRER